MTLKKLEEIVNKRQKILDKLNQYTGALEELTFLMKTGYITTELYNTRFDKIMTQFTKLKEKFHKLGDLRDEL